MKIILINKFYLFFKNSFLKYYHIHILYLLLINFLKSDLLSLKKKYYYKYTFFD